MKLQDRLFMVFAAVLGSVAVTLLLSGRSPATHAQQPQTRGDYWSCGLDAIGATLTKCTLGPGARAPRPGERIYITDIVAQSTTGTAGQFILRFGSGTNCGTGTTSLLPSAATAVRLNYNLFSGVSNVINLKTPLVVPPVQDTSGNPVLQDVCGLGVATNLLVLQLVGEVGP